MGIFLFKETIGDADFLLNGMIEDSDFLFKIFPLLTISLPMSSV